jgi:hypothetical protein
VGPVVTRDSESFAKKTSTPSVTHRVTFGPFLDRFEPRLFADWAGNAKTLGKQAWKCNGAGASLLARSVNHPVRIFRSVRIKLPICNTYRTRAARLAREFFREHFRNQLIALKLRRFHPTEKSLPRTSFVGPCCNTHRTRALAPAVKQRVSLFSSTKFETDWLPARTSARHFGKPIREPGSHLSEFPAGV